MVFWWVGPRGAIAGGVAGALIAGGLSLGTQAAAAKGLRSPPLNFTMECAANSTYVNLDFVSDLDRVFMFFDAHLSVEVEFNKLDNKIPRALTSMYSKNHLLPTNICRLIAPDLLASLPTSRDSSVGISVPAGHIYHCVIKKFNNIIIISDNLIIPTISIQIYISVLETKIYVFILFNYQHLRYLVIVTLPYSVGKRCPLTNQDSGVVGKT